MSRSTRPRYQPIGVEPDPIDVDQYPDSSGTTITVGDAVKEMRVKAADFASLPAKPKRRSWNDGLTAEGRRKYVDSVVKPDGVRHKLWVEALEQRDRPARVVWIAKVISSGRWRTPLSVALSPAWGISVGAVSSMVSEAAIMVNTAVGDKEEIRANALMFLEKIAHTAFQRGQLRDATSAIRNYAEIAGILRQEVHHTGSVQVSHSVRTLTDAELNAAIATEAAKLISSGEVYTLTADVKRQLAMASEIPEAQFTELPPEPKDNEPL